MATGDIVNTIDLTGKYIEPDYLPWSSGKEWLRTLGDTKERDLKNIFYVPPARKLVFIAPPLKIRFSVPVERVETMIFNPRVESRFSTRSTVTANQILKRVAMKNSIHYSKKNTAKAFRQIAAQVSLGQQTSHSCNRSVSSLVM